jgi:glycosyltransferase involved in cell wall biosynthesis
MKIGIDGSRAFLENRTGIEEYSYQTIKHLRDKLNSHQVVLYLRNNQELGIKNQGFELPENWKVKVINFPRFWTQIGLSLEMLLRPVDVLFVPAHTVPIIHSRKTIVTIHGLEYEFCPKAYSFWEKIYMRCSIKFSCKWASRIISVSENTRKDLMRLYNAPENKIEVIYDGYDDRKELGIMNQELSINPQFSILNSQFLLFVGRLEERKNILGIIEAFEILKKKYQIPHKLILAGRGGYGYDRIKNYESRIKNKEDIIETGYISDEEKFELMRKADVFLFPTFYEGFGIPVLEAQSVGAPVVAGNNSSIPEIVRRNPLLPLREGARRADEGFWGEDTSAVLVDVSNSNEIAEATYKLISNKDFREEMIQRGYENIKRFSWEKCAQEVAEVLKK